MKEYISYFWLSIQITLSLCSDLLAPVCWASCVTCCESKILTASLHLVVK